MQNVMNSVRKTNSGKSVCSFRLAVDAGKDKKAYFFSVVAWNGTAENICKYFGKGDKIAISGILTSIVIGTVTGLGITLTAYLLDKIDLFGVIRDEKHAFVMTELDQMIDADISSVENLVGSLVF